MKGGAYGAFARPDHLEKVFSFSSYRDPDPFRTLETFLSILKDLSASGGLDDLNELDKAVIGSYSKETRPSAPADKTFADFLRFFYGIEERHRSSKLKSIIGITPQEIAAALERLASSDGSGYTAIIAGRQEAEKAAAALGVEPKELPV
jgi:Zn-dependent M16 (insulinase) family peptidase